MYSPYFEFTLTDEQSVSVFDDESLDLSETASSSATQFPPISESGNGSQFMSELQHALKSLRRAAALAPQLDFSFEAVSLLSSVQDSVQELWTRVSGEATTSTCSSPIEFESREVERAVTPPLTFPDYSSVLRPKATATRVTATGTKIDFKPIASVTLPSDAPKMNEQPEMPFTTLTFAVDGSGVSASRHEMGPPKNGKSKRGPKTPYSDHLKAWRSQPYGPRQLSSAPADLMMDFVIDPTTTAHQHNSLESASFFITPPSAHQYNRQLN